MTADDDRLRSEIARRLLARAGPLPTSALGRLGRTALAGWRGGRLLRRPDAEPDLDALTALVGSLGELKGIAMKVGQIMSYADVALPEPLRAALSALQTSSPPMPFEVVRGVVRDELGARGEELLARMEPAPAAAASIGQVHRAWLGDEPVAVKVRYPGVEEAIASDFRPAKLGARLARLMVGGGVEGFIAEARARFLEECDYGREARHQERFAALFRDHATLTVPRVHAAHSAARVLTTSWADGRGFASYLAGAPAQAERDRVGAALFEFYVGTLFLHGLYNCDPHPGNYVFQADGRVAMLDFGCCRAFEPDLVARLAELTLAVHARDPARLDRALVAAGLGAAGHDLTAARSLVAAFHGPMLRDEVAAIDPGAARSFGAILTSKRELARLELPGELLFLLRIRFGLVSILATLGARANWYRLEQGWAEEATARSASTRSG